MSCGSLFPSYLTWWPYYPSSVQFSSVAQSCPTLRPHESQQARPPCPSPIPGVYPNPCLSSRWYHPAISFSVVPFSSCPQSLPASGSFPMSQLFAWGGQSPSASVLPMRLSKTKAPGSLQVHPHSSLNPVHFNPEMFPKSQVPQMVKSLSAM